jgi:hypothetical protein
MAVVVVPALHVSGTAALGNQTAAVTALHRDPPVAVQPIVNVHPPPAIVHVAHPAAGAGAHGAAVPGKVLAATPGRVCPVRRVASASGRCPSAKVLTVIQRSGVARRGFASAAIGGRPVAAGGRPVAASAIAHAIGGRPVAASAIAHAIGGRPVAASAVECCPTGAESAGAGPMRCPAAEVPGRPGDRPTGRRWPGRRRRLFVVASAGQRARSQKRGDNQCRRAISHHTAKG